jgi:hypothetical protein
VRRVRLRVQERKLLKKNVLQFLSRNDFEYWKQNF